MPSLTDILKNCCLKDTYCGPFTRLNSPLVKLFKVKELNDPVEKHFKDLRLMRNFRENVEHWNERKFIESRIGKALKYEDEIRYVKGYFD